MAFDVKAWLKNDLQMSDEDVALVETKLAPKADMLEKSHLRQQDYSAKLNEITKLQGDIAAKDERLNAEAAEWASLTAAEKAANDGLRKQMEQHEEQSLKLRQRLTRVASEAGLDPADVMKDIEAEPVTKPAAAPAAAPTFDDSKYVSREQFNGVAAMALEMPAALQQIAEDHRELTGARLDTRAIITEIKARANARGNTKSLDPYRVWEEMHDIPAKRTARDTEKYNTEIKAAEDRGRQAAITEASVPGGTPVGRHAPVFNRPNLGESKLQRPQPGTGVSSAVAAFTSGKYRDGGGKQKTA